MSRADAGDHDAVLAAVRAHRAEVEARRATACSHGDALLETLYGRAARKLDAVADLLEQVHNPARRQETP
ncbi:MAG: hypothetical protein ACRDY6_04865 [Acidimicrobiia bacterium]